MSCCTAGQRRTLFARGVRISDHGDVEVGQLAEAVRITMRCGVCTCGSAWVVPMMVDTGATVSMFEVGLLREAGSVWPLVKSETKMSGVSGMSVRVVGAVRVAMQPFGVRKRLATRDVDVVAIDVQRGGLVLGGIIGVDVLTEAGGLLVDVPKRAGRCTTVGVARVRAVHDVLARKGEWWQKGAMYTGERDDTVEVMAVKVGNLVGDKHETAVDCKQLQEAVTEWNTVQNVGVGTGQLDEVRGEAEFDPTIRAEYVGHAPYSAVSARVRRQVEALQVKYEKLFGMDVSDKPVTLPDGTVVELELKVRPECARKRVRNFQRPMNTIMKAAVRKRLQHLRAVGAVVPVESPHQTAMIPVRKPNGEVRLLFNFVEVNAMLDVPQLPIPNLNEEYARVRGAVVFTTIDLTKCYWQFALAKESQALCAFVFDGEQLTLTRVGQGLAPAPGFVMKHMRNIVGAALWGRHVIAMIDDLLVFANSEDRMVAVLDELLGRLMQAGVVVSAKKCIWCVPAVGFCGRLVSGTGLKPLPGKMEAIQRWPRPRTKEEVRTFCAHMNWWAVFIPGLAGILAPLTEMSKKGEAYRWGEAEQEAFDVSRVILLEGWQIEHVQWDRPVCIFSDASKVAVGSVVTNLVDGVHRPVMVYSKKLTESQRRVWTTEEMELFGLVSCVIRYRFLLEWANVTLYVDHKNFEYLMSNTGQRSARVRRWRLLLGQYRVNIMYVKGVQNPADGPSRIEMGAVTVSTYEELVNRSPKVVEALRLCRGEVRSVLQRGRVRLQTERRCDSVAGATIHVGAAGGEDVKEWVASVRDLRGMPAHKLPVPTMVELYRAQQEDPELRQWREEIRQHGHVMIAGTKVEVHSNNGLLVVFKRDEHGALMVQVVVPGRYRPLYLQLAHGRGHRGALRTAKSLAQVAWWPGCVTDAKLYAATCITCPKTKLEKRQGQLPLSTWVSKVPYAKWSIDMYGPLPESRDGYVGVMTAVDKHSRWPVAVPVRNFTAVEVGRAFIRGVVVPYGIPVQVTSDRGSNFVGAVFTELARWLGVKHVVTPAYAQRMNGTVERFHKELGVMLRALLLEATVADWPMYLPLTLYCYRTQYNSAIGTTPYFAVHGRHATPPTVMVARMEEGLLGDGVAADMRKRLQIVHRTIAAYDVRTKKRQYELVNANRKEVMFPDGAWVMMWHTELGKGQKLRPRFSGPWVATRGESKRTYDLKHAESGVVKRGVFVDRLRLFLADPECELARVAQRRVRGEVQPVELTQRDTEQLPSEDDEDGDEGSEGGRITVQATEAGDGGGEKGEEGEGDGTDDDGIQPCDVCGEAKSDNGRVIWCKLCHQNWAHGTCVPVAAWELCGMCEGSVKIVMVACKHARNAKNGQHEHVRWTSRRGVVNEQCWTDSKEAEDLGQRFSRRIKRRQQSAGQS